MKTAEQIRKENNEYVLKELKAGKPMATIDMSASWFPPRPIIKKNPDAFNFLKKEKKHENCVDGPAAG